MVRGLRERGIASVAVYSDADRASLAVTLADEAAYIGPAPSSESYLKIETILAAARKLGADAIHPGYGFLSENADFAAACRQAGITFIGPPAEAIHDMGSKTGARKIAIKAGAPVVPGTEAALKNVAEANEDLNRADCKSALEGSAKRACEKSAKHAAKSEKAAAKAVHEVQEKKIDDSKK